MQLVPIVEHVEQLLLHAVQFNPLMKYPELQVPQVALADDKYCPGEQVEQLIADPKQVKQFELQEVQFAPPMKYPGLQIPHVALAE